MATRKQILNDGLPTIPEPAELTEDLQRYSEALVGVRDSKNWGDYLAGRIPTILTSQAVATDTHTAASAGPILHVQATTASSTGPKSVIVTGSPLVGQVLIAYSSSGIPTLTFAAGDAVTVCAYDQMVSPSSLVDFLAAESPDP